MEQGTVIFLNGASSSGKTTIARALLGMLDEVYLTLAVDDFVTTLLRPYLAPQEGFVPPDGLEEAVNAYLPAMAAAYHHAVATLAGRGANVIIDHVLQSPAWLYECVTLLAGAPVLFVGVRCPLDELERREAERDREPGTARYQYERVHAHGLYDVEVDTAADDVQACAARIVAALRTLEPRTSAFRRLRARYAGAD
jgi:chloramphenicol 3-O-phosphotransferase